MITVIKKAGKGVPEFDWGAIKTDWIAKNLVQGGKPFSLKQVAKKWGASYGTVKNRAHKDKWRGDLTKAMEDRDKRSIQEVKDQSVWSVSEVRWRQARMARMAMAKAMEALNRIKVEDLTQKNAIRLLELGLEQERRALGIPTITKVEHEHAPDDVYESVEDRMARVREFRDLAVRFKEFVASREVEEYVDAAAGK